MPRTTSTSHKALLPLPPDLLLAPPPCAAKKKQARVLLLLPPTSSLPALLEEEETEVIDMVGEQEEDAMLAEAAAISAVAEEQEQDRADSEAPLTAPKRRYNKRYASTSQAQLETEEEMQRRGEDFVNQHLLSDKTLKNYRSAIFRARTWLERAKAEGASYTDGLDILGANSGIACQRWMEHHVDRDDVSYGSISLMHAAFVNHFHKKFGCSKHQLMGWEKVREGQWRGNPAYGAQYLDLLASAKRKDVRSCKRIKRSLPMLYPTLAKVLTAIQKKLAEYDATPLLLTPERTHLEFMHAFMIVSYRLWTRCEETCQMEWGDLDSNVGFSTDTKEPYRSITLTFRKTNQLDPKKSNTYHLPKLHTRPLVDVLYALPRWQKYWEFCAQRPPQAHDLMFPSMYASTGQLRPAQKLRNTEINTFLKKLEVLSTVSASFYGTFTTHCFRRGGLQDSTVHAHDYGIDAWSIGAAKWWGGWSQNESQNTLMKYLFEETQKKEEWYGDMQTPRSVYPRQEFFAGGTSTVYTKAIEQVHKDFTEIQYKMDQQSKELAKLSSSSTALSVEKIVPMLLQVLSVLPQQTASSSSNTQHGVVQDNHQIAKASQQEQVYQEVERQRRTCLEENIQHDMFCPLPAPDLSGQCIVAKDGTPLPQHIPEARSIQDVVRQWEKGDPSSGLLPLCKWVPAMRKKGIGNNAMTYSNRKTIYKAFADVGHSYRAFLQKYGDNKTLTEYCTAIRQQQKTG